MTRRLALNRSHRLGWIAVIASAGAAAAAIAAELTVEENHIAFSTAELAVHVGDAVTFSNNDRTAHKLVITGAGAPLDKGNQPPGVSVRATFATAGVYDVICAYHPNMKMKITVK